LPNAYASVKGSRNTKKRAVHACTNSPFFGLNSLVFPRIQGRVGGEVQ
jgi:hypothetical protein